MNRIARVFLYVFLGIVMSIGIGCVDVAAADTENFEWDNGIYSVNIDTENGASVTDKETYVSGVMSIYSQDGNICYYEGSMGIKGRGNSTWYIPKKPYKVKLDKKSDLLGMGTEKHWVLLANAMDECFMRTTLGFGIANSLKMPVCDARYVELTMNGTYLGLYQLVEQIRVGDERVNVFDWENEAKKAAAAIYKKNSANGMTVEDKNLLEEHLKEDLSWISTDYMDGYRISDYYDYNRDISGGYLFELDDYYDEVSKFTTLGGIKVMVKSPEFLKSNEAMMAYVQKIWNEFETALSSVDGYTDGDEHKHYTELADMDSMVNFWLVNEITGNLDSSYNSRYAYKDLNGKITFGPVWDFDWSAAAPAAGKRIKGWLATSQDVETNFFKELVDDPYFCIYAAWRYWQIRPELEKIVSENGLIDFNHDLLKTAALRDETLWSDKIRGFEEDTAAVKEFYEGRLAWIDEQFTSSDSAVSGLRFSSSTNPYYRMQSLKVSIDAKADEMANNHIKADGVITEGEPLSMSVSGENGISFSEVKVYVNGIFYKKYLAKQADDIRICSTFFDSKLDNPNVINIMAFDDNGELIGQNFAVVRREAGNVDHHEYEAVKKVLPDYDNDGYTLYECTFCKDSYKGDFVKKLAFETPVVTKVYNSLSGIVVNWNTTGGALGYNVYRHTEGTGWEKIAVLTGNGKSEFFDRNVVEGEKYFYTVKAFRGNRLSGCNGIGKSVIRLTQPSFSLENCMAGVKVSWITDEHADKYCVYRRKSASQGWVKVYETDSPDLDVWIDKNAEDGNWYQYTVKAVNGYSLSSCHKGKSMVRLKSTDINEIRAVGSAKAVLYWNPVYEAMGYQIRYSKVKEMTGALTVSNLSDSCGKTLFSLEPGQLYYVQVRSFKTINGVKYYSGWSIKKTIITN